MTRGFASLGIIILLVVVVIGGGAWYWAQDPHMLVNQLMSGASSTPSAATSTAKTMVPASQPAPATSTNIGKFTLATTTQKGVGLTVFVGLCGGQDFTCFGSGARTVRTQNPVVVYARVSKDCQPSYGVYVKRERPLYYEAVAKDMGAACDDWEAYDQIADLLVNAEQFHGALP